MSLAGSFGALSELPAGVCGQWRQGAYPFRWPNRTRHRGGLAPGRNGSVGPVRGVRLLRGLTARRCTNEAAGPGLNHRGRSAYPIDEIRGAEKNTGMGRAEEEHDSGIRLGHSLEGAALRSCEATA